MSAQPESPPAIAVRDIVKRYPRVQANAVDGVTFSVRRGEIFGLLGPNGAGKTTTIGVLITGVVPTSGSATLMGIDVTRDPIRAKQRIAVVPQQSNLDHSLKVREILIYHAAYHGVPKKERNARADMLLDELGLGVGKVLPSIGLASASFSALLPGIVSLTVLVAAMQGVTMPLVLDLGFSREIDDRLLAPLPVSLVALEKCSSRPCAASSPARSFSRWPTGFSAAATTCATTA